VFTSNELFNGTTFTLYTLLKHPSVSVKSKAGAIVATPD
jgi:hypothetical protein